YAFVSYSRAVDSAFVRRLEIAADRAGVRTWIDTSNLEGGKPWSPAVDRAIRNAGALLLVATETSVKSPWVNYEWAFALGAQVPILPIILLEPERLHPVLHGLNGIDCRSDEDGQLIKVIEWVKEELYPDYRRVRELTDLLRPSGPKDKTPILEELAELQ